MSKRRPQPDSPAPDAPLDDDERAYLERYDASAFERPSVAVDVVVLSVREGRLEVALYRRREPPQRGRYALPGGFVRLDESLDEAAARVLRDKVGVEGVFLEQLYTFGSVKRDPRTRVITVAYYALVAPRAFASIAAERGALSAVVEADWPGEVGGPARARGPDGAELPLFVDHADILGMALKRLRGKIDYSPVGFQLLPESFPLRALQEVHEAVRGEPLNKDSFRRRLLATGHLEATGERERDVAYRPAELYRFVRRSAV